MIGLRIALSKFSNQGVSNLSRFGKSILQPLLNVQADSSLRRQATVRLSERPAVVIHKVHHVLQFPHARIVQRMLLVSGREELDCGVALDVVLFHQLTILISIYGNHFARRLVFKGLCHIIHNRLELFTMSTPYNQSTKSGRCTRSIEHDQTTGSQILQERIKVSGRRVLHRKDALVRNSQARLPLNKADNGTGIPAGVKVLRLLAALGEPQERREAANVEPLRQGPLLIAIHLGQQHLVTEGRKTASRFREFWRHVSAMSAPYHILY